ncbi:hypothetical protein JCM8115_003942 [Rhodotorula mucilaginosa]
MHELALREKRYPDLYPAPHGHYGHHGKGGPDQEKCKTARKEWTEAKTESNGDRVTKAGRQEVTYCRDGTTRWRSESTTIISHAETRQHFHSGFRASMPGDYYTDAYAYADDRHHSHPPHHPHKHHHDPERRQHHHHSPPHHHHHHGDQQHGHRSRSLPPPGTLLSLPAPPSPAHISLRSPGGHLPGGLRSYEDPRGGDHPHRRQHAKRIESAHKSKVTPLASTAQPRWKERARELVL